MTNQPHRHNRTFSRVSFAGLLLLTVSRGVQAQIPEVTSDPDLPHILRVLASSGNLIGYADSIERVAKQSDSPQHFVEACGARLVLGQRGSGSKDLDAAQHWCTLATERRPDWPSGWLGVAQIRIELNARRITAKEGVLQPIGTTNLEGAEAALTRALRVNPTFLPAIEALLSLSAREDYQIPAEHLLHSLEPATDTAGPPRLLLARARLESELESYPSALISLARYLDAGGDSAIGLFERSRTLFALGQPDSGVTTYFRGAALIRSAPARSLFRQDIVWIAHPEELASFDATVNSALAAWLGHFWGRRDVEAARSPGERLREHNRRFLHAWRHFRRDPSARDVIQSPIVGTIGAGSLEGDDLGDNFASDSSFSSPFDHRGLTYLRHGEPDDRIIAPQQNLPTNETWRYRRPDGDLLLNFVDVAFDADAGATTLIPSYLAAVRPRNARQAILDSRCGFDGEACKLAAQNRFAGLRRDEIQRDIQRGRSQIARALSTDDFTRRFERTFKTGVQLYALGSRSPSMAGVLAVFTLPWDALVPTAAGLDGTVYQVQVRLSASSISAGGVVTSDSVRRFRLPSRLENGQHLSGVAKLPLPAGSYSVSLVLSDSTTNSGSAYRAERITVPDFGTDRLALGDMILGRAGSGLTWDHEGETIPINPLNWFGPGESTELWYQIDGLTEGSEHLTTIELMDRSNRKRWSLSFRERARSSLVSVRRTVVLRDLAPGDYRLVVTVSDPLTGESAVRERALNIVRP